MKATPDQARAIDAEGEILVMAGAGTGKTRTMVSRCLDRIFRPNEATDLDRILMVTFTEAAAAEMKERIGSQLHERFASQPSLRARAQIALLDSARIGTLHSFAFDLIREYAHELGLSNGLRVLTNEENFRLAQSALSETFQRHYQSQDLDSKKICAQIRQAGQGKDAPIRRMILRIHHFAQSLPHPTQWLEKQRVCYTNASPRLWQKWLVADLSSWLEDWQTQIKMHPDRFDNLLKCAVHLDQARIKIADQDFDKTLDNAFETCLSPIAKNLREAMDADNHWKKGTKTKGRPHFKALFEDLDFLLSNLDSSSNANPIFEDWERGRQWILTLLQLSNEFGNAYRRLKRRQEGVDFQDLEQLALELLYRKRCNEISEIAETIRCRFDYVFVDEYQDINGAQDAIIKAVSCKKTEANLFIVGDIKQSIYRFRRGNPKIFSEYEQTWKGATIYLQKNFRSDSKLLDFVNDFFTHLSERVPGFDYGGHARLEAGRANEASKFSSSLKTKVELHILEKDAIQKSDANALEIQAHLVAEKLLKLRGDFAWSDIAILLRSLVGKSQTFAQILSRYGIPVQAAAGTFFEFPEITDLLALLNVIDNPLQDLPLLAFLRSPFCGWSVNDLALIRLASPREPFWKALQKFSEMKETIAHRLLTNDIFSEAETERMIAQCAEKCDKILDKRKDWLLSKRTDSIADQLEKILDKSFYIERISALHPSRSPELHIRQFIDLAREFDHRSGSSLTQFLQWMDQLKESEDIIEAISEEGRDAVWLMSIHKSKGLEFPLVVLPDLEKRFNRSELTEALILDEDYGLCPTLSLPESAESYPSIPHWLSQRKHRIELIEEEARLLYVAMTRARDHLWLVGTASKKQIEERNAEPMAREAHAYLDWIAAWMWQMHPPKKDDESLEVQTILHTSFLTKESEYDKGASSKPIACQAISDSDSDSDFRALNDRLEWAYPFLDSTLQRSKASVSSLKKRLDIRSEWMHSPSESSFEKSANGREKGTAYHCALQFIDPDLGNRPSGVQAELRRLVSEKYLTSKDLKHIDPQTIVAFWNSEVGAEIRNQAEHLARELRFTARFSVAELHEIGFETAKDSRSKEPIIIQGVIDFAVILKSEIWLLDFKSEPVSASSAGDRAEHHRAQLTLYQKALERIYRRPITRCWVHFLMPNATVNLI